MNIRTETELYDSLSKALSWRKKELCALKLLIDSTTASGSKQQALLRSGVTILYAHWEGFIKEAASAYLEFVATQHLPYKELTPNFIALSMKEKLESAIQTDKASILNNVANFFLTGLSGKSKIPYKNSIITKSNLSSEVFKEIICTLNLDHKHYDTKKNLIDEKLLKKRNSIAHGEFLDINLQSHNELHTELINMMDLFMNLLCNLATTKAYLSKESTNKPAQ